VRGGHATQGRHRLRGTRLLHIAHQRIEYYDREDRDRLVGQRRLALEQPQRRRDRRGDEQQNDQGVGELREKLLPARDRTLGGQLVAAVARKPRARLLLAQPAPRIAAQLGDDLIGSGGVGCGASRRSDE
jgi:hypothetical protein